MVGFRLEKEKDNQMSFRSITCFAIIALGLVKTAVFAQIPEKPTFRPATFGHAQHVGFYNAGSSDGKITYANTGSAPVRYGSKAYGRRANGWSASTFRHSYYVQPQQFGPEGSKLIGYTAPGSRGFVHSRHAGKRFTATPRAPFCPCEGETVFESKPPVEFGPKTESETFTKPQPQQELEVRKKETSVKKETVLTIPEAEPAKTQTTENPQVVEPQEPPAKAEVEKKTTLEPTPEPPAVVIPSDPVEPTIEEEDPFKTDGDDPFGGEIDDAEEGPDFGDLDTDDDFPDFGTTEDEADDEDDVFSPEPEDIGTEDEDPFGTAGEEFDWGEDEDFEVPGEEDEDPFGEVF